MPHACALFGIGVAVGYVLKGIFDDINKALKKEQI
jgi:Flp pilus assembly pilin Flp